jgi:uncharacterized damage-inducible protein DinB
MPAAHALVQVREEVPRLVAGLSAEQVWARPGQSAPIAFHIRHIGGSLDRLLTYARGEALDAGQRARLVAEREADGETLAALLASMDGAIERALGQIAATDASAVTAERRVGKAQLPSTVLGLVFHAAEHATRHAGQIATLGKVLA